MGKVGTTLRWFSHALGIWDHSYSTRRSDRDPTARSDHWGERASGEHVDIRLGFFEACLKPGGSFLRVRKSPAGIVTQLQSKSCSASAGVFPKPGASHRPIGPIERAMAVFLIKRQLGAKQRGRPRLFVVRAHRIQRWLLPLGDPPVPIELPHGFVRREPVSDHGSFAATEFSGKLPVHADPAA